MRGTTEGGSDQGCECSGNCDFDAPVRGREDPAQCRLSSAVIHFHAFTTCLRLRQMLSISRRLGKWSPNLQPSRPLPSTLSRRAGRRETCPIRPFMVCSLMSCRGTSSALRNEYRKTSGCRELIFSFQPNTNEIKETYVRTLEQAVTDPEVGRVPPHASRRVGEGARAGAAAEMEE